MVVEGSMKRFKFDILLLSNTILYKKQPELDWAIQRDTNFKQIGLIIA